MTLYARDAAAFDAEQVGLLESLSADLSYALDALDHEEVRARAEAELHESREKLRLALRSSSMGAWRFDLRDQQRHFDEQVCRCLGIDPARFGGTEEEFFAAVHPDDHHHLKTALAQTITAARRMRPNIAPSGLMAASISSRLADKYHATQTGNRSGLTAWCGTSPAQADRRGPRAGQGCGRGRQCRQEPVPGQHEPRAAHAHERHPGHDRRGVAEGDRSDRPGLPANRKGIGGPVVDVAERPLDSAKIESGKLALEAAPFSLRRMLDQITRVLAVRASEKGLCFCCRMPDETPDAVLGDRMRLQQVLLNLAGNAIKFTERGDVVIGLRGPKPQDDDDRRDSFAVSDTGIGIPASARDRLFQPFAQADASMSRRFGGTGLGLSICKSLVELMGGRSGSKVKWARAARSASRSDSR